MKPSVGRYLALLAVTAAMALSGCSAEQGNGAAAVEDPDRVNVTAAADDPVVQVAMGDLRPGEPGTINYSVDVTWLGEGTAMLDDARFTHHVAGAGEGDLVLSGRNCSAAWDEGQSMVTFDCTADREEIRLSNGSSHSYPVRLHTTVGPQRLTPGTYSAEQVVGWQQGSESGEFTITLTVVVQ